jgi:hypothetical protein
MIRAATSEDAPPVLAAPPSVAERLVKLETQVEHLTQSIDEMRGSLRLVERLVLALAATSGGVQLLHTFLGAS